MKLRNKKTGDIVEFLPECIIYNSLAELEEDWEDYKETKDHWHIGCEGDVFIDNTERHLKNYSSIGNDFDTREEAEKAVEKLKACKRLKDNGYKFNGIGVEYDGYKIYLKCDIMKKEHYTPTQDHKDLDLLFGGE